jgi:hypothetical protein
LQFPKPIYLAGDSANGATWNGGELVLNTGSRAAMRAQATDEIDESYKIEQIGGTSNDATIKVTAFGRTRVYEHVTSIRADMGTGDDMVNVLPSVKNAIHRNSNATAVCAKTKTCLNDALWNTEGRAACRRHAAHTSFPSCSSTHSRQKCEAQSTQRAAASRAG